MDSGQATSAKTKDAASESIVLSGVCVEIKTKIIIFVSGYTMIYEISQESVTMSTRNKRLEVIAGKRL